MLWPAPPARPGMIRADNDASIAVIALEVWALPPAGFGAFVAGIQQPLCIGAVNLSNGAKAKGFLAEIAGLEGAEDIARYSGWQAYLQRS